MILCSHLPALNSALVPLITAIGLREFDLKAVLEYRFEVIAEGVHAANCVVHFYLSLF